MSWFTSGAVFLVAALCSLRWFMHVMMADVYDLFIAPMTAQWYNELFGRCR